MFILIDARWRAIWMFIFAIKRVRYRTLPAVKSRSYLG